MPNGKNPSVGVAELGPNSRSEQSPVEAYPGRESVPSKIFNTRLLDSQMALANFFRWAPAPSSRKDSCNDRQRMTTVMDEKLARLRTHCYNIGRYRRLLKTKLTDLERHFTERRLSEEQSDYERLSKASFPIVYKHPTPAEPAAADEAA
jgi:hypothetical protein